MTTAVDYAAFAAEVREFALSACPEPTRKIMRENRKLSRGPWAEWQQILYAKGWGAPGWPKEFGGMGWDARQRFIFDEMMAECDCPPLYHHGLRHLGPTLIKYGTEEQKQRFLPGILNGTDWWCQGFSEPGAGSDLASLKCAARREGDKYIVNGQKIWTSHAHEADLMYTLVRTSREDRKQKGITLLLIPVKSKGITVRPIRTLDGFHHVNEVFLDDVEVPVENRLGDEGDGWTVAKYLLGHERLSSANTAGLFKAFAALKALVESELSAPSQRRRREAALARMAVIEARMIGLREQGRQAVADTMEGRPLGIAPSVMKLIASELVQEIDEMILGIVGPEVIAQFYPDGETAGYDAKVLAIRNYLLHRANTIYGGSSEVQRDMIARELLGR